MNLPRFLPLIAAYWTALMLPAATVWAQIGDIPVHPPPVRSGPLAEKGALIFADDFSTNRFDGVWTERIPSAGVENGVMYGRQTTTAHGSVASTKLDLPDGNLICECRVQFERNVTVAFSFDDMTYPDSVAGHIARVTLEPQLVKLHDDKEGAMNRKLLAWKKSEGAAAKGPGQTGGGAEEEIAKHTLLVPMKLETQKWYLLGVEIVGDRMRVTLDGEPIGLLQSPGLAYEKKPDMKISVSGKQALFGNLRIWTVKR